MTKLLLSVLTGRIRNAGGGENGFTSGQGDVDDGRKADRVTLERSSIPGCCILEG